MIITLKPVIARPGIVTMTGIAISEAVVPALTSARSYIWFNRDGTFDTEERVDGRVQQFTTTDWIDANHRSATVGDGFQVRYVDAPASAFTTDAAGGVNNWVTISSDCQFGYEKFSTGTLSTGGYITFEIRRVGGSGAIATGEYSMSATMTTI